MAAVLQQNQPNDDPKDASENENNKIKSLDLIEALELRREMRKIRARQSYLVSKFNRMKKIKSKR